MGVSCLSIVATNYETFTNSIEATNEHATTSCPSRGTPRRASKAFRKFIQIHSGHGEARMRVWRMRGWQLAVCLPFVHQPKVVSPLHMCVHFETDFSGELPLTLTGIKSWLFDLGRRLIERYKSLKNLAQDRDALRRRLDEELLARVCLQIHYSCGHCLWSGVRLGLNLGDVTCCVDVVDGFMCGLVYVCSVRLSCSRTGVWSTKSELRS